ncbi:Gfo/Idh/MocA family oxidoreductase [candidate division KSB1 bacterium]|nr:Gfo/Idh/MocA family oxidoreductase [candidate division KSB1 bacterium]
MVSGKPRFAIIGAGAVAAHHVKALQQIPGVKIVTICRRDEVKARQFAEKYNLSFTVDFNDILADSSIDAVDITLPSGLHADIGVAAAKAGKHVIVEKPIDVTLEKADLLIQACRQAGVTLGVMSQYRFMDAVQDLYRLLDQKKLGELIQGDAYIKWYRSQDYYDSGAWRGTWALDGGGPFINQGIHFIDLLLSVMGPVRCVYAKTKNVYHKIEVEDIGMAMLEFTSGAYGVVQATTAVFPGLPARLEIHGTEGTVCIEGEKMAFKHIRGEEAVRVGEVTAAGAANPMSIDVTPFVREFEDFIDAINEKRTPIVNGLEARRSLELILAIYRSSREGRPVQLVY